MPEKRHCHEESPGGQRRADLETAGLLLTHAAGKTLTLASEHASALGIPLPLSGTSSLDGRRSRCAEPCWRPSPAQDDGDRRQRHTVPKALRKRGRIADQSCVDSARRPWLPVVRYAIRIEPLRWLSIQSIQARTRSSRKSGMRLYSQSLCGPLRNTVDRL